MRFNQVYKFIIAPLVIAGLLLPLVMVEAITIPNHNYPRTVNLFWKTPLTRAEAKKLAKWDMVALDMQAQTNGADAIRYLRKLNPTIIILAYTSANEIPIARISQIEPNGAGLWHDLRSGAKSNWELKTYDGKNISWWAGNISMNLYPTDENGLTYADYLVNFYQNKVLSTGLWDGLLFDNIWQNVSSINGNIDIDSDGIKDGDVKINELWQKSYNDFFKKLRDKFGDKYLIIGNGDGVYFTTENGRMLESFPEYFEGGWTGSMKRYQYANTAGLWPRVNIVNSDTDNTGNLNNYQAMRYGLTSTLLFDGYFSFDYGPKLREQFWWYDEYEVNLGQPKSGPINLLDHQNTDFRPGVWQRDFVNGIVIVNSTDAKEHINLDTNYEKIHGAEDPKINNGARVNSVDIDAHDGVILLRPVNAIKNAVFVNGSFAKIFNQAGKNIRESILAYDQNFPTQAKIIKTDTSSTTNIIAAENGLISFYTEDLQKINSFYPFGSDYHQAISLAMADLNNDGVSEIIAGAEVGHRNLVSIFTENGQLIKEWSAYNAKTVNLGVNVAVGDVNGDGQLEIVTGAGYSGKPHIKVFTPNGKLISEFLAYSQNFRGGVNIAVGDVDGNGIDEIITGPGKGGGPHLKIFNMRGQLAKEWFPYATTERVGLKIAVSDIDGDGKKEIFALTTGDN